MKDAVQASYDRVAEEYAVEFRDELEQKPFDRKMLDWLIERVGERGLICDMGCGPGQVAEYLAAQGAKACGVDLSAAMVERAQSLHPGIRFEQGDMQALDGVDDGAYAGIAAFYSLIHLPRTALPQALQELKRVLSPDGTLLLTFHIGREIIHRDEWWGKAVSLDFIFFESEEMKDALRQAGFELLEVIERDPYRAVEYQSRRAYIFARKP
jgi:SAM-dependent methyltransferase